MRFKVEQSVLNEALSIAGKVISGKNSIVPILDNFRFEIMGTQCKITGRSGSMFISKMIELIEESDLIDICIDAEVLRRLVKTLPKKPIDFEVIKTEAGVITSVELTAPTGIYTIIAESGDNYLKMAVAGEINYDLDGQLLIDSIARVRDFINPNDARILKHMLIDMGNGVKIVGTDANRLMVRSITSNTVNKENLLIAKSDAAILATMDCEQTVNLAYTKSDVVLDMGNGVNVSVRLQSEEKKYPDYTAVITKSFRAQITIPVLEFQIALRRASIFSHLFTMQIDANGDQLSISTVNIDTQQESFESISCDSQGEAFKSRYTTEYMLGILSNVKSENALLFLPENDRMPISILEEGTPSAEFVMILMPIGEP